MGRDLIPPLAQVQFHYSWGVDRVTLVRVNHNAKEARVGVDQFVLVPDHRIPQDASISQISQTSHVIGAVKFWRVDLGNLVFFEDF